MSEVVRQKKVRVVSGAAAVDSDPVRTGGNLVDVQIEAPAALAEVQVSADLLAWFVATDIAGTSLTALGDSFNAGIREGGPWMRLHVAIDASQPRNFDAVFNIHKQAD